VRPDLDARKEIIENAEHLRGEDLDGLFLAHRFASSLSRRSTMFSSHAKIARFFSACKEDSTSKLE
jgi:hypothetical protein